MQNLLNLIIGLVLLFTAYIYLENRTHDVAYVKSNIDGEDYLVRNLPDKQQAADLLAKISRTLSNLSQHLANMNDEELNRYVDKGDLENKREAINRLNSRFKADNISESTPHEKYTSYSINKGEKIVFCLRSKANNEQLVSENIIIFVALHELAHVMTESVGHTDEFWNNFQFLLKVAVKEKMYHNQNYNENPVDYCGTKITDTPLKPEDEIRNN